MQYVRPALNSVLSLRVSVLHRFYCMSASVSVEYFKTLWLYGFVYDFFNHVTFFPVIYE